MAALGSFTLLAAFVACAYAIAACVAGARRRSSRVIESGIGAFYLVTALMTLASAIIVHAFITQDYSIRYVDRYSDSVQPLFYKLTSYWGGLDGSIMFWVFLLSVFGAIAVKSNRERQRELIPYVVAVIRVRPAVLSVLDDRPQRPVSRPISRRYRSTGAGSTRCFRTRIWRSTPPSLYTGFVGMTIPFRVRDGGADHGVSRRLLAARGGGGGPWSRGCSCRSG